MNWEEKLVIYKRIIESTGMFDLKGKTVPYTSANGHMFSQLNKDGEIGIRLPKEEGKAFMEKYDSGLFKSYGAVLKDYVLVPDELLKKPDLIANYLNKGYDYVMSMKPK